MKLRATRLSATGNNRSPVNTNLLAQAAAFLSVRVPAGSTYKGPLLRVRRSSDNTEQDIFAGAPDIGGNRFIDQSALLAFVGSGSGFVTRWYDQTRNNRNAVQTNQSLQPRIVNAGVVESLNGRPALSPNGTGELLWSVPYAAGHTLGFVASPSPAGSQTYMLAGGPLNNNVSAIISGYNAPFEYFSSPRFTIQATRVQTRAMVTSQDGGTAFGYVDNTQTGSGAVTTNLAGQSSGQLFRVNAVGYFRGLCQEVFIYNRVVSSDERTEIFDGQSMAYPT